MCCVCEQGSQPSTASPFKQDVFVYSASPGSESPGVGAPATPVIMSRSPTGGSRPLRLCRHFWGHPELLERCLGMGLWLWVEELCSPWHPRVWGSPILAGSSGDTAPGSVVLDLHGQFVSFLNQSSEVALAVALFPLSPLTGMCSSRGNSVSRG